MRRTLLFIVILVLAGTAMAQESDQWEWTVAPYIWAIDVGLDLSVSDQEVIGGDADFKDLVDKLDTVFLGISRGAKAGGACTSIRSTST